MRILSRGLIVACMAVLFGASPARAQTTGSITGSVTDASGAVLPGVSVSLNGERLIGGGQQQTTDADGNYRFDRLPPGTYQVKFELQGFKTIERSDIRINAAFVATVPAKMEVGNVTESITVSGESPTVDTKSNVRQTVLDQQILEGIPTGRDPWSLARLIPGVGVATYDVGGTQSMQQSAMSAAGSSTNDVSYNIDGATVNWPGGGGGATMLYYDQGMFEEINYTTAAIPAEFMAGGISINMVTKVAGNPWRGNMRYSFSNDQLQTENHRGNGLPATFLGNPTLKTYDANLSGGGAIVEDRLWVNGTVRRWVVNKLTNAKNLDGSQALDDNTLKNYSGKVTASLSANQKLSFSYLWNDKIRGHRRDTPPNNVPDIAALVQTNPAQTTQIRYTGIRNRLVYESSLSIMDGQTNYGYQPGTPADAIRRVDNTLSTADDAAGRHEEQPNSRHQLDNVFSYALNGFGGNHQLKAGVQFGRLYFQSRQTVQGDHWVEFANGAPTQIRQFNTPANPTNLARVLGIFFQDSWSVGSRLTLNLGFRFDRYTGILPAQSNPGGPFIAARTVEEQEVIDQKLGVWRTGVSYDLTGNGRTALKASYSRYGLQVGIDRVTAVNPLSAGSRTCPWNDANGDRKFQANEITAACSAFGGGVSTFYAAGGVNWPYSDEVTAGIEQQVMKDMSVGVTFSYRTNRDQLGVRNTAVPSAAYTPFTASVPNGPNGPTTVTVYNLASNLASAQNNIRDNESYLNTEFKGVAITANKRFSDRWQMVAGLTFGKNEGGLTQGADLNDPNVTLYQRGVIGNDSTWGFRASGSYVAPGDVTFAGSVSANRGYPFVSTYQVTRAAAAPAVILTRASQTVPLSQRGDERLSNVTLIDLRISRSFKFGNRSITPQLDIFNITNSPTVVALNAAVGGTYLAASEILAPRIIRLGFSLNF